MDKRIHAAGFLGRQVGRNIETLDLASNARLVGGSIKTGNWTDSADAGENVVPGFGDGIANRRDESQTGHDDSTTRQGSLLREKKKKKGAMNAPR
jgi:hypothetical protein